SVSAMIPSRTFGVSGVSSGYAPPAQPRGTPARTVASIELPVVLRNCRRECFMNVRSLLQGVRDNHVREVVRLVRGSIFGKRTGKNVRIPGIELHLWCKRISTLNVRFFSDMTSCGSRRVTDDKTTQGRVETVMRISQPPRVIAAGH